MPHDKGNILLAVAFLIAIFAKLNLRGLTAPQSKKSSSWKSIASVS